MRILGASTGAAAAAACSPRHGTDKIIPLLIPAEDQVPGLPTFYQSICQECPAGCGLTARTREGRVVKLEGNLEHPLNRGALCGRGQAALQGLYDPARPQGAQRIADGGGRKAIAWEAAFQELGAAIKSAQPTPQGVLFVSGLQRGTLGALFSAFARSLGDGAEHLIYEPFDPAALRAASLLAFGREEEPVFRLDRADFILSLSADLLENGTSPVESARWLAEGRAAPSGRSRLVHLGPLLTLTGATADEWFPSTPGSELAVALGLLRGAVELGARGSLGEDQRRAILAAVAADAPEAADRTAALPAGTIRKLAAQLLKSRRSLVVPPSPLAGDGRATSTALAVLLLNWALGNVGSTVLYGLDPDATTATHPARLEAFAAAADRMRKGEVKVAIFLGVDPLATLPRELGFGEALAKVPTRLALAVGETATAKSCTHLLPIHHFLESFGDVAPRAGWLGLAQPTMTPVGDSRDAGEVLLRLAQATGLPASQFPFKDLQTAWRDRAADFAMLTLGHSGDLLAAVREGQQHGGLFTEVEPASVTLIGSDFTKLLAAPAPLPPAEFLMVGFGGSSEERSTPTGSTVALIVAPDVRHHDGRSSQSWLQEIPDPLTRVAWTSVVQISPATAQQLGVSDGEWVELRRGAQTASYPAVVLPGLVNSAVAIPAGAAGALALLATSTEALSGARIYGGHQVELRGLKRQERLPRLEGSSDQQGRELARRVSGRETLAVPAIARATLEPVHLHPKHRWAMAIDLDSCNGCQACVVACYAENNLGILGPEQVAIGRTMSWIRMDRFYAPPEPNVPTKVSFLPVLCQQCCEAPCETVCPVDATFHTAEGLNAQVYNRCVGTRYCANNCPYKARVFNYADHSWPAPSNLQLNPDVTVREKGVMEKCTFCVQRIRLGERTAEKEGRPVRDGEVVSACAQTCPAHAITFGDLRDPSSAISKIWGSPRAYGLMEELNTEPGVRYLARVDSDSPPRAEPKPDKEGRP